MTENPSNDRQDPAEQYRVDEAVETEEQAPEAEPEVDGEDEPEVDGEDEPAPAEPVEVTAPAPTGTKTHTSLGTTYTVDPDRGMRVQR